LLLLFVWISINKNKQTFKNKLKKQNMIKKIKKKTTDGKIQTTDVMHH
jgi:hypothetical protein